MRTRTLRWLSLAAALGLAACNSIGPEYKNAALDGIVAGPPKPSLSELPAPKTLTVGLIASGATELTLEDLAKTQKDLSERSNATVKGAAGSYDPSRPATYVAELLRSRFGRVELISDMNGLAKLPQPAIACVFDLRLSGINDLGGQRLTATSELWFLDHEGAVAAAVQGRAYRHLAGGQMGQAAMREWITLSTSTVQQAMEDMRAKLDMRLGEAK